MDMFSILGRNDKRLLAGGFCTEGRVTKVRSCWWLKINKKPVRIGALDGAGFPHIIYFAYTVDNRQYHGRRYVNRNARCPVKGERITVYYDPENPSKYGVRNKY